MGAKVGSIACHGTTLNIGVGAPSASNPGAIGDQWWQTDTAAQWVCIAAPSTWQQIAGSAPAANSQFPQGRLTLTSGVPVMISSVTDTSAVYYAPYIGNQIPILGAPITFAGSLLLTLTGGNNLSGHVYDVFAIFVGGVLTLVTGPSWTNTTTRSAGTAITQVNGIWVNSIGFTGANGGSTFAVAANAATYLGSIYCDNAGVCSMGITNAANGGGNNFIGVYNAYNRVSMSFTNFDSTSSAWALTINTGASVWANLNASVSNRVTWLDGLGQTYVDANITYQAEYAANSGAQMNLFIGLGLNSTSTAVTADYVNTTATINQFSYVKARAFVTPILGLSFIQALQEANSSSAAGTALAAIGGGGALSLLQGLALAMVA